MVIGRWQGQEGGGMAWFLPIHARPYLIWSEEAAATKRALPNSKLYTTDYSLTCNLHNKRNERMIYVLAKRTSNVAFVYIKDVRGNKTFVAEKARRWTKLNEVKLAQKDFPEFEIGILEREVSFKFKGIIEGNNLGINEVKETGEMK